jgi:glycosyltransferase involved in cell wall biosynthesis
MEKVSIMMPCYNHSLYLSESIDSILNQSHANFELIIVDDCSNDNSAEIIRKYALKDERIIPIYHEKNGGEAKSRNDALSISKGEYIAFCDSDDIWESDKLRAQIEYLNSRPEYNAIHTDSVIIDGNGIPTGEHFSGRYQAGMKLSGDLFEQFCLRNFVNIPTVVLRRKCIKDGGKFEENFKYLTDWIYWVKVSRHNKFGYIPNVTVRYRIHGGSTALDTKGYPAYRIMGYHLILDKYPDLNDTIKSKIYYFLGVNYLDINDSKNARIQLRKSITHDKTNIKSLIRIFQATGGTR